MSDVSSTSTNASAYNRITGLATGLDTETMVDKMLTGEKARIFKIQQDKQMTEWEAGSLQECDR